MNYTRMILKHKDLFVLSYNFDFYYFKKIKDG